MHVHLSEIAAQQRGALGSPTRSLPTRRIRPNPNPPHPPGRCARPHLSPPRLLPWRTCCTRTLPRTGPQAGGTAGCVSRPKHTHRARSVGRCAVLIAKAVRFQRQKQPCEATRPRKRKWSKLPICISPCRHCACRAPRCGAPAPASPVLPAVAVSQYIRGLPFAIRMR